MKINPIIVFAAPPVTYLSNLLKPAQNLMESTLWKKQLILQKVVK